MILDSLKNQQIYLNLHPRFRTAFNFLLNSNLFDLPDGKHLIESEDIFALMQTYQSKSPNEMRYEAHHLFIDIQYIISGKESFYYSNRERAQTIEPYCPKQDVEFFEANGTKIQAIQGQFYILFPNDVHKPSVYFENKPEDVKKVVIKVRI